MYNSLKFEMFLKFKLYIILQDVVSILGNTFQNQEHISITGFHLTKGISNFLNKNVPLKGTLTRNKNKDKLGVRKNISSSNFVKIFKNENINN